MSIHLAIGPGIALVGVLLAPAAPSVLGQDFAQARRSESPYQPTVLYDRVMDSTRVSLLLGRTTRPFGLGSRVWVYAWFAFKGRRPAAPVPPAVLSFESWTPSRGGWAFAHPQMLQVRSGKARLASIPASRYIKRKVHLFDSGRREVLSFQISSDALAKLSQHPELVLRVGKAEIPLSSRQMAALRVIVGEMRPATLESR